MRFDSLEIIEHDLDPPEPTGYDDAVEQMLCRPEAMAAAEPAWFCRILGQAPAELHEALKALLAPLFHARNAARFEGLRGWVMGSADGLELAQYLIDNAPGESL